MYVPKWPPHLVYLQETTIIMYVICWDYKEMLHLKKILLKVLAVSVPLVFSIWGLAVLKCEILTFQHGKEFVEVYKENTMMGEIDGLKVLNYSDKFARVYFISKNRMSGDVLIFTRNSEKWIYESWEQTVWSKTGSADGFIWPYIR